MELISILLETEIVSKNTRNNWFLLTSPQLREFLNLFFFWTLTSISDFHYLPFLSLLKEIHYNVETLCGSGNS